MISSQRSAGRHAALGVLLLVSLTTALARGLGETFAVFLLPIGQEMAWQRGPLTSIYSVCMGVTGLVAPMVGLMLDHLGPRLLYGSGLLALGGGLMLAGSATHLWHLIAAIGLLVGYGISAIGIIPASALLARWYDRHLATANSIAYAGFGSGTLVLAPLAQVLIDGQGWRGAYYLLGGVVLAIGVPALFLPWSRIAAGRLDHCALGNRAVDPADGIGPRLAAATRTRGFWALFATYFVTALGVYAVSLQSVAYLVEQGFEPLEAASAFGFTGMLTVIGMIITGTAADRYGNRITATISYLCTLTGIVALFALQLWSGFALVLVFVLFFGISLGARGPILATLSSNLFPGRGLGAIYGAITMGQGLGAAAGSWLTGILHDVTGGYDLGFVIAGGFILAGITLFWTVPEMRGGRRGSKEHAL